MKNLTHTQKEAIATARRYYQDWMGTTPENQLSAGIYVQKVGRRYITVLNTWQGQKKHQRLDLLEHGLKILEKKAEQEFFKNYEAAAKASYQLYIDKGGDKSYYDWLND